MTIFSRYNYFLILIFIFFNFIYFILFILYFLYFLFYIYIFIFYTFFYTFIRINWRVPSCVCALFLSSFLSLTLSLPLMFVWGEVVGGGRVWVRPPTQPVSSKERECACGWLQPDRQQSTEEGWKAIKGERGHMIRNTYNTNTIQREPTQSDSRSILIVTRMFANVLHHNRAVLTIWG